MASGEVRVETDDAVVYADHMVYDEAADRAEFTGSVVVEIEEGIFRGERCVMYPDAEEMEFIGPFAGEFWRN